MLEGKTVTVVGVGPGLGREIATVAARDGASVMIAARSAEKLDTIATGIDPDGRQVAAFAADITDPQSCLDLMAAAVARFGSLDAVVVVAALDTVLGGLRDSSPDDWRKALEVNVIGTINVVRAAVEPLSAGGGAIVLIGSQSMLLPSPAVPQIAYAASKGALLSATYHLAQELGPDGIRVNMVVPTWMWGPPVELYVDWQSSARGVERHEIVSELTAGMPLGEIPADEEVADAVVFLCSDRSRMITGQSLLVNAGELMR
ncbi:MAG: Pyridoxal 4-dehydrogenase [Acidimicrobiales bacterium]|nr:MAG: SDR family oxidoreductase [Actinomycetota bacterium]MBV6509854.1 Pyridoxal 4-dehydrogenase [Acidimicrobiales bacterium]RIK06207.1 MAG: short-chain dehydrogenase [Acidobacteriota bacterium]